METCSNCGASLRPGAKFCTICGTRLNEKSTDTNQGWGTPRTDSSADTQETSVFEAVTPPASDKEATISGGNDRREYDRWTSAYSDQAKSSDDPASRFISALEDQSSPAEPASEESTPASETDPESTWVTPPSDAFKAPAPAASTWSYQAQTDEPAPADDAQEESSSTSTWRAPSTWNAVNESEEQATEQAQPESEEQATEQVEPEHAEGPTGGQPGTNAKPIDAVEVDLETDEESDLDDDQTDAAGFHDGDTTEVDYLSGDENIAVSGPESPKLDPDDARSRAIELVDELRRMVRMMPGGGEQDHGAAAMALTEASLNVTDFDDVRAAIAELQDDPRDIQALSGLATKADKIELLLDEHASLRAAIETALKELNG